MFIRFQEVLLHLWPACLDLWEHLVCSLAKTNTCCLQWFLDEIKKEPLVQLAGVHSHLGSTITQVCLGLCIQGPGLHAPGSRSVPQLACCVAYFGCSPATPARAC